MDNFYPEELDGDLKQVFDLGWTMATENVVAIWEGFKEQSGGRTEAFEAFDDFISLVTLKLAGATNEDLAQVAELSGDFQSASYLREG